MQQVEMNDEERQEVTDYVTTAVEQSMKGGDCELDVNQS